MYFEIYFVVIFGILGLVLGSFFAHLIYSKRFHQTPFNVRSKCDTCKSNIAWYDNIPLVSYILLRGKCRKCHTKINSGYFWIELSSFLTFVIFAILQIRVFKNIETLNVIQIIVIIIILSTLYYSSIYDIYFFEIQEIVVLCTITILLVIRLLTIRNNIITDSYILAAVAGIVIFTLTVILSKGKMGGGEIRYGLLMGLILGLRQFYVAFMLSLILAILGGIGIYIYKKCNMENVENVNLRKIMVPLVPFLSFSTVFSYFYGDQIFKLIFKF